MKPTKCIVLPRFSPIDKYVAVKRVLLDLEDTHRFTFAFCNRNIPTPADHELWDGFCSPEARPAYLVDIGEKKYHKIAGSASEVEKMSSETTSGRTWNRLVELVTENNKTGFLKQYRHSVAKLIRDVYHVMAAGDASQEVVFDHGMDVVNAFFFAQNKREWTALFDNPEFAALRELWNGFSVGEKEVLPFTLPLYFRQLFMSGRSPQEITTAIGWWLDKAERVKTAKRAAGKKQFGPRRFFVQGRACACVTVSSQFESEAFNDQWLKTGNAALAVIRQHDTRHVAIMPSVHHKNGDFTVLAGELEQAEPGRWYFEARFVKTGHILMNGSRQFTGVTPTSLSDNDLIQAVSNFVTFGPHK